MRKGGGGRSRRLLLRRGVGGPVDLVEREFGAQGLRVVDEPARHARGHGLPSLVERDVRLGYTDAPGQFGLGHPQLFANGMYGVHAVNISRTDCLRQQSD